MNKPIQTGVFSSLKRAYQRPKLKLMGSVSKLTLKMGFNTDGMGGFV